MKNETEIQQLVDYIKQEYKYGMTRNAIENSLVNVGWDKENIKLAFDVVDGKVVQPQTIVPEEIEIPELVLEPIEITTVEEPMEEMSLDSKENTAIEKPVQVIATPAVISSSPVVSVMQPSPVIVEPKKEVVTTAPVNVVQPKNNTQPEAQKKESIVLERPQNIKKTEKPVVVTKVKSRKQSNFFSKLFATFFVILLIAALPAGYVYYRFYYLANESDKYYEDVKEDFTSINKQILDLDTAVLDMNIQLPDVFAKSFSGNDDTLSKAKKRVDDNLKNIATLESSLNSYLDKKEQPNFCTTVLKRIDYYICTFHKDTIKFYENVKTELPEYKENLEYIKKVLAEIEDYSLVFEKGVDSFSPLALAPLTVEQKINLQKELTSMIIETQGIVAPEKYKDLENNLVEYLRNVNGFVGESAKVSSDYLKTNDTKAAEKKFYTIKQNFEKSFSTYNNYVENFQTELEVEFGENNNNFEVNIEKLESKLRKMQGRYEF